MGGEGADPASFGVPFSWEHKPGVSKAAAGAGYGGDEQISRRHHKVPIKCSSFIPPPPPLKSKCIYGRLLPAHHGDHRDDPFLAAYWNCTDQEVILVDDDDDDEDSRRAPGSRRRWLAAAARKKRATAAAGLICSTTSSSGAFSCKYSCGVRSDNLVRVSTSNQRRHHHQRQNAVLPAASPAKLYMN